MSPEIIHAYNSTRGAVDTFNQMCQNMCTNRKTKNNVFFYNMINIAIINSYVIYCPNVLSYGGKPIKKDFYMIDLHKKLSKPSNLFAWKISLT